jgi:hypothetical protein
MFFGQLASRCGTISLITSLPFRHSNLFSFFFNCLPTGLPVTSSTLHLLGRVMPIRTTTLQQSEIQDGPRSAAARHYSLTDLAELRADFYAAVSLEDTYVVGVSVELSQKGVCVQTLVLALRDQVFCLSLRPRLHVKQRQVLQELFSNIHYLAGFEMPHTIVLLAHLLDFNISGYDLTTIRTTGILNRRGSMTPGEFWNSINPSVNAHRVNKRWDGGETRGKRNPSGMPRPNYAIRAWFTAMYVRSLPLLLFADIRFQGC